MNKKLLSYILVSSSKLMYQRFHFNCNDKFFSFLIAMKNIFRFFDFFTLISFTENILGVSLGPFVWFTFLPFSMAEFCSKNTMNCRFLYPKLLFLLDIQLRKWHICSSLCYSTTRQKMKNN